MLPPRARAHCPGTAFVVVDRASIERFVDRGATSSTNLRGRARVCTGCDHVDVSLANPVAWADAVRGNAGERFVQVEEARS